MSASSIGTDSELLKELSAPAIDRIYCRGKYDTCDAFLQPTVLRRWPDLFEIVTDAHQFGSERHYVSLIGNLAKRHDELSEGYKDEKVRQVAQAFKGIRLQHPATTFAITQEWLRKEAEQVESLAKRRKGLHIPDIHLRTIRWTLEIVCLLEEGIGHDLRNWPSTQKIKQIKERVNSAIKVLTQHRPLNLKEWRASLREEKVRQRKGRRRPPRLLPMEFFGREKKMPLPWLAIEFARYHVEDNLRLPSKKDIRKRLVRAYPNLKRKSLSSWADVWQKAGLSESLDRSHTVEYAQEKRSKDELIDRAKRRNIKKGSKPGLAHEQS